MEKRIVIFLLLILPFVSSSLLAAKYPIKRSGDYFAQQMAVGATVMVYANAVMDIKFR